MKSRNFFLTMLVLFFALGFARLATAQQPERGEGKATIQGKAGDTNVDIRVQKDADRDRPARDSTPGPTGPAGERGPQGPAGPAGPSGPSGGQVLGMDPTIALLVGLGVLAVVIVAIVAASRGREH